MKLDKRIIEGKKPLDCLDVDIAKTYIGKKGYFANCLGTFQDLESANSEDPLKYATLKKVDMHRLTAFTDDFDGEYSYFLPEEWVTKPEKKYIPYTLNEWIEQHEIGEVIHYRNKSEGIEFRLMYMGYAHGIGKNIKDVGVGAVTLGLASYTLDYLFEDCEIEVNGKWLPFGVIEDD